MTSPLRTAMRSALTDAMRSRDRVAASALRSGLAALDNAEAVPVTDAVPLDGSSPIAGAAVGVGATEATRRELSARDEHALVRAEVTERRAAAAEVEAAGRADRAADLHHEADVLETVLAQVART
ncbi:hypothetical protein ACOCJ5_06660 [Knoellia sp. CPCC 206450]|uniref:hypothetical protein n=1 Tax=Knoellia tibetensis TaxID=3404798 RepID=UPI003B438DCB